MIQNKEHSLWVEKYRPDTLDGYVGNEHILEKVNQLTSQEEAALFTTFKSAYNNFILFKNDSFTNEQTGKTIITNKIINSNQSEVNRKAKE